MKYISKFLSLAAIVALIAGSFASLASTTLVYANNGLSVSAIPSTGTLVPGDTMEVRFGDPSGTTDAVADSCIVNGVDVTSTFANIEAGLYKVTYTVGASDASRAAGTVPIDCTLHQMVSVTVTGFDDNNTVAIDTTGTTTSSGDTGSGSTGGTGSTGGGTTTPAAPSFGSATISPLTGTLVAGQTAQINIAEAAGLADLTVAGDCKVNNVDVSGSFSNLGGGHYGFSYTVGSGDGERPAGHIPLTCTLGDSAGTMAAHAWTDSNTLAIDTNNDGSIDNGTNNLGFTIEAVPSTGTLAAGNHLEVYMRDPLPSEDVVLGGACTVNGVDVSGSYQNLTGGLYKVTYAVQAGDTSRAAGAIPFDCTLQNHTGSVHLTSFTDSNTVAVDAGSTGGTGSSGTGTTTSSGDTGSGGTGSTGGSGSGSTGTTTAPATDSSLISSVAVVPNTGSLVAGSHADVYFNATSGANDIVLGGACRVNDVDVSSTFQNLTGGLYKVVYTVGALDSERAAGTIPLSCAFRNEAGSTTTAGAFTDSNTLAIDTNNDGTITAPTGATVAFLSTVTANPSTGTLSTGDRLDVYMQEGNHDAGFSVGACTVNGVNVASSFTDLSNGLYKVSYTVGAGDESQAAGQVPVDCELHGNGAQSGQTISTIFGFTDSNTVAISASTGSTGGTGSTGTGTTTSSGDTGSTGTTTSSGDTGSTGGTGNTNTGGVTTPSMLWVSLTADASVLHLGDQARVYFQESHNMTDLSLNGICQVNGVNVSPLETLSNGMYRLTYTVGSGDVDRSAGMVPFTCALRTSAGATTTINGFDANAIAIQVTAPTSTSTGSGTVGGDVNNGQDAALAVTAIDQVSGTATAGGGYAHGWSWVFHITVPNDETSLSMKFADWTHSNGTNSIPAAGNMRISSSQAATTSAATIDAAGTYSAPLTLTGDLDSSAPGRQIEVTVEMKVPAGAINGSYTTSYGVKSVQ